MLKDRFVVFLSLLGLTLIVVKALDFFFGLHLWGIYPAAIAGAAALASVTPSKRKPEDDGSP